MGVTGQRAMLRSALLNLAAIALALICAAPLVWMVNVSLMPKGSIDVFPPPFWPRHLTLENYSQLLRPQVGVYGAADYKIMAAAVNSLALALWSVVLGLLLTVPAGYAFAKLRFQGRARLLQVMLALVVIPGQVAMLPLFLLLKTVGLVNSYAGILAPGLAAIYGVLLVRQAALALPDEMLDAARMDGAGEGQIFVRIVLPLLRPVIVTLALFTFLASWSDFLWPLIVTSDERLYTLPVALAALSREHAQDSELMMAGAVITTLPVMAVFLALQRYYIGSILGGSVKG